jgi:hypothetical protein
VFNSYAPLQEEQGVAAVDRPALAGPTRGLDEADNLLPTRRDALAERRLQKAEQSHEDAIFGAAKQAGGGGEARGAGRGGGGDGGGGGGGGGAGGGLGLGLGYASSGSEQGSPAGGGGGGGAGGAPAGRAGAAAGKAAQLLPLDYGDDDEEEEDGPVVVELQASPGRRRGDGQQQRQPDKDLAEEVVGAQKLDWRQRAAQARGRRAAA